MELSPPLPILYYILPSNGKNHGDRRPTSSEGGAHEKQAHSRFSTASLSDFTIDDFSDANAFRSFGIEVTRPRGSLGIFHPWIIRRAVNVNQSCRALCACTLGSFSHTSRFPISCALWGLLLGRLSSGQRQPIVLRTLRLHSWVVFAYEPFPNQLRPSGLLLGRLSKKAPPRMRGVFHQLAEAHFVSLS